MMTKVLQLEISLLLQITTNQGDIVFKKLLLFNFIFSGFFCVLFCFVLFCFCYTESLLMHTGFLW